MRVCFSAVSGRAGFQSGNLMGHFPILGPAKLTERDDMISLQKHGWLVVVLAGAAHAPRPQRGQQSQTGGSPAPHPTPRPPEATSPPTGPAAAGAPRRTPPAEKK